MTDGLRLCLVCGSPAVDFSELTGGEAKCRGCGWVGKKEDLALIPTTHTNYSEEQLLSLVSEMRALISTDMGVPLLKFLIRWGFLSADLDNLANTVDRKLFSRYLAAIAKNILVTMLSQREALEKERVKTLMDTVN